MLVNSRLQIREFAASLQVSHGPSKSPDKIQNDQIKKIQNDQIKKIASEALPLFDKYITISTKHNESLRGRIEMCSSLSDGLKLVATRVHQQKSLIQRLLSIFTYASPEEKELDKTFRKISAQLKKSQQEYKQVSGSNAIMRTIKRISHFIFTKMYALFVRQPEQKLIEGYYRVIGNTQMTSKNLEGNMGSISLDHFKRDLTTFISVYSQHLDPKDKTKLEGLIPQLEKAYDIQRNFEEFLLTSSNSKEIHAKTCKEMMYDVTKEIENLKSGESMIFPGGFIGHAVMYKVRRDPDNTFSFIIINTGAGSNIFHTILKKRENVPDPDKAVDYELVNLTIDEVTNPEFLMKLGMAKTYEDPSQKGILAMLNPVLNHLLKGTNVKLRLGHDHPMQVNGTCAYSRIEALLESEVDPALFKAIVQFMNKQGLQNIVRFKNEGIDASTLEAETSGETLKGAAVIDRLIEIGKRNSVTYREHYQTQLQQKESALAETQAKVESLIQKYGFVQQTLSRTAFNKKMEQHKITYYRTLHKKANLSDEEIVKIPHEQMPAPKKTLFNDVESLFRIPVRQQAWIAYQKSIEDFNHCVECVKVKYKAQLMNDDVNQWRRFSVISQACAA